MKDLSGLRVLLSAYALEPSRGSEPGLGWMWAETLSAAGCEVTVLTSGTRHRAAIETYAQTHRIPFAIDYVDFAWPMRRGEVVLQHLHYLRWLVAAGRRSKSLMREGRVFDVTHQVTWASIRFPTLLARNGSLMMGPMGGAEQPATSLASTLPLPQRLWEVARLASIAIPRFCGLTALWLKRVDVIALANADNMWAVPPSLRSRVVVGPSIGVHDFPRSATHKSRSTGRMRTLFIGRLLGWKGAHLALAAIAELARRGRNVSLTLVGEGPDLPRLRLLASELGIADRLEWVGSLPRRALVELFDQHDVLVFPSLHDSGGMVVMEALARAVPVVVLDVGGPGLVCDGRNGIAVPTRLGPEGVVSAIADGVEAICANYEQYSRHALASASRWEPASVVGRTYQHLLSAAE